MKHNVSKFIGALCAVSALSGAAAFAADAAPAAATSGFRLNVDALYMKTCQSLEIGSVDKTTSGTMAPRFAKEKWDMGYRAAVNYSRGESYGVRGAYTFINGKSNGTILADGQDWLAALSGIDANAPVAAGAYAVKSHTKSKYSTIDLDVTYDYKFGEHVMVTPYFGVRYLNWDQKATELAVSDTTTVDGAHLGPYGATNPGSTSTNFVKTTGTGLHTGLDFSSTGVMCGIDMFGGAGFTVLLGTEKETKSLKADRAGVLVVNAAGTATSLTTLSGTTAPSITGSWTNNSQPIFGANFNVGVEKTFSFNCGCKTDLTFRLGYEMIYWDNLANPYGSAIVQDLDPADSVLIHGVTLGAGFKF